ncbi:hypothetical protein HK102_012215, partial [Quaeritorhiza haematococci]
MQSESSNSNSSSNSVGRCLFESDWEFGDMCEEMRGLEGEGRRGGGGAGLGGVEGGDGDWIERAKRIMEVVPMVDTHNDFPMKVAEYFKSQVRDVDLHNLDPKDFQTDINRMREGRMGAQFWSAYVSCNKNFTVKTDDVRKTMERIDLIKRMVALNRD